MEELERKTDCDDPKHRDVVYCLQCSDRDIAAMEKKLSDAVLQNSELKRLASEDQAEIRRIERKADGLKKELDYAMAAGDIQNKELEETKRLVDELKKIAGTYHLAMCRGVLNWPDAVKLWEAANQERRDEMIYSLGFTEKRICLCGQSGAVGATCPTCNGIRP